MKIPFVRMHVFWTPWWDADYHMYDCPIEIAVHTPYRLLLVRPFGSFASANGERSSKWWARGNTPEGFARLPGHRCRCRYCVWCLHDEETCRMSGGHDGSQGGRVCPERYVRHGAFLRHLWLMHVREHNRCGFDDETREWIRGNARDDTGGDAGS